jgi:hypothetical protein
MYMKNADMVVALAAETLEEGGGDGLNAQATIAS